jgi:polyphenol oxidase
VKLTSANLAAAPVRHGFFTREGGVSEGIFTSLNCGYGSGDEPTKVAENRGRVAAALDVASASLITAYQVHGTDTSVVIDPWDRAAAPRADAMATRTPGVALGILTADCAAVLLTDPDARVIGAAHAGWRGALNGVLESAIGAMERLGARRARIHAAIGPCIGAASYEVGPEFPAPFLARDPANAAFFAPAARVGHFRFDLAGYVAHALEHAAIASIGRIDADTYADPRFFSYRRTTLAGEKSYGRALSVIALAE